MGQHPEHCKETRHHVPPMSAPQSVLQSMPYAPEAEQGVLSCLLHSPDTLLPDAATSMPQEWLYNPAHRLLYSVMLERHASGALVEYITLSQHLQDRGLMDKIGGQGALADLLDFVPIPAHYGHYKAILREKWLCRSLIALADDAKAKCYEHQEDVAELVGAITEGFFALSKQEQGAGRKAFKEDLAQYCCTWEDRLAGRVTTGIPTRWPSFNATFGGILPRLWLIAGFPSDGKSALLQNLAEDALAHGKHVLWFSYEMDETEIIDRLVTARTGLDSREVFFPQNGVSRTATRRISQAVGELQGLPLHLRCEATWTADQIVAETRAMALKHPVGLVAIDYLQLVPTGKQFNTRAEEVAYMSRAFKLASAALGIPFVVLSQLNDDGKTKESRAPTQDASNIIFIETESETTERGKAPTRHPGGLRVVKNRNGKRGDLLPICLNGPTFTFREDPARSLQP